MRFQRRERRAERDYVDWVLLALATLLRDGIAAAVGVDRDGALNLDLVHSGGTSAPRAAASWGAVEEARAALAEDINLNPRLVLEQAFLRMAAA